MKQVVMNNLLKYLKKQYHSFSHSSLLIPHSSLLTILPALLLLVACGNKVVLDEERTIGTIWNRFTPEEFEVTIPKADLFYHVDYTVTFDTSVYRYDRLPLVVDIYSADGTHRHISPVVTLRENGRWKGQQVGPNRVVRARVHNYFSFNQKGTYSYQVKQATSQYDLEGVRAFNIHIEEAELEYNLD